jgi:hypothetical protein
LVRWEENAYQVGVCGPLIICRLICFCAYRRQNVKTLIAKSLCSWRTQLLSLLSAKCTTEIGLILTRICTWAVIWNSPDHAAYRLLHLSVGNDPIPKLATHVVPPVPRSSRNPALCDCHSGMSLLPHYNYLFLCRASFK